MRSLLAVAAAILLVGASIATACPLAGIKPQTWEQGQTYGDSHNTYTWYLSPCDPGFPSTQAVCPSPNPSTGFFGQWDLPSVSGGACQQLMNMQTSKWTEFSSSSGPGYTSEYTSATGSTGTIVILCDANAANLQPFGDVIATEISSGKYSYQVNLKSNAACNAAPVVTPAPPTPAPTPLPSGETFAPTTIPAPNTTAAPPTPIPNGTNTEPDEDVDSGCGGGCIFLLLLGVGLPVYAVGAVAWNFRIGKRGKELAPHPGFWMEIISLVKEGCVFFAQAVCGLVDKCRGKSGGGGGEGYSSV